MTQTTRAAHELAKHRIPQRVSPPPVWVPAPDLLRFLPALLLHVVRKAPGIIIRVRGDSEFLEEVDADFFGHEMAIEDGDSGGGEGRRARGGGCRVEPG